MTIIEATASGFKDMADGTVRFFFDVEPRHAEAALRMFRARGTAAALAALLPDHQAAAPGRQLDLPAAKPGRERMGPLCEWAVYRCKEPEFQDFIRPIYDRALGGNGDSWGDVDPIEFKDGAEGFARHAVLFFAGCDSRKELDTDKAAGERFKRLVMQPYAKAATPTDNHAREKA